MTEFKPGLEGVVAFETEIAEPDRDGGSLRYRGVDIEELVGTYRFEQVWGLLVDESLRAGPAGRRALHGRRPDGEHARRPPGRDGARRGRVGPEEADRHLRRRGARGSAARVGAVHLHRRAVGAPRRRQDRSRRPGRRRGGSDRPPSASCSSGAARPTRSTSRRSTRTGSAPAEHGLNASTFVARITASTGADCAAALSSAVGALSGPLHGGAPARVLPMLDAAAESGDPEGYVESLLETGRAADGLRPPRLPRRGSARPAAQGHGQGARVAALRGGEAARAGRAGRAAARVARPAARDERRVLVGGRPRRRRRAAAARAGDVRLLAHGRLVGAHPRAEASSAGSSGRPRRTSGRARAPPSRSM